MRYTFQQQEEIINETRVTIPITDQPECIDGGMADEQS